MREAGLLSDKDWERHLQNEYAQATTAPRMGEIQERLRNALAERGWTVPHDCWLPMRCPGRGYCTMFLEGSQTEVCSDE